MAAAKPSSLVDTRVIYCGDNLEQLKNLPAACVDLIYIDPPFNSNRNYEVFWGETKEKRAFEDRHESTKAYIDYMRPRCVELARVLKKTGCFYYHCDWHASHYVKVMLDQIFGENNFQNEIVWKRTSAHNDPAEIREHSRQHLFLHGNEEGLHVERAIHCLHARIHRRRMATASVWAVLQRREHARSAKQDGAVRLQGNAGSLANKLRRHDGALGRSANRSSEQPRAYLAPQRWLSSEALPNRLP